MALYQYEAKTMNGMIVKGKIEGVDENEISKSLRNNNYYPVSIKASKISRDIDLSKFQHVSVKDISLFCRQLSFSISAGISISKALELVKNQTENVKLRKILFAVWDEVQKGKSLSEALGMHNDIPNMLINMVEVGEVSGTLDEIMERMANYYDKEYRLNQKIKSALTYPLVVSIFSLLVIIMLVTFVLPKFISTMDSFGGGELPLPTKIVLGLSNLIQTQGILIIIITIILTVVIKRYAKSEAGAERLSIIKLKIPLFGKINNKILTAKFARTFGTLMASGVPLLHSMTICAQVVGNKIATNVIQASSEDIKKGGSLGEALESRALFPPMLTQMIKIGEESGTLDVILEKTAEFYDNEVDTITAQLTTILEPLIIIVLAAVVGFIVLSVIMPMFGMYNAMNNAS